MTKAKLVFDPFSETSSTGYETYRRMRDEAPVYYSEEHDFYALTRHEDVAPAFKDYGTFSSAYGVDLATVERRAVGQGVRSPSSPWTHPRIAACAAC